MDGADKAKKKDIVEKLSDFAERNPNVQKAAKNKSPFAPKKVKSNKNLLSKSVVISENEASAARLEEIRRYQQQIGINAEIDAKKQKAIKTTITVLISLIFEYKIQIASLEDKINLFHLQIDINRDSAITVDDFLLFITSTMKLGKVLKENLEKKN